MHRTSGLVALLCLVVACEGPAGPAGPSGPLGAGVDGPSGPDAAHAFLIAGPGLKLTISAAEIEGDTARVRFKVTDGADTPLDITGRFTEGAVTVRAILAYLDGSTRPTPCVPS